MGKKRKATNTEIFLLAVTAVFLVLMAVLALSPAGLRQGSFTVTEERSMAGEEKETWQVNINTATEDELQKLPGIGPVLAERIIAYRTEHGPFASVEELQNVEGIGDKILDGVREQAVTEETP